MTLAECIAAYHAAQPTPIAPYDVLAPLGDATVTLYRLKRQIEALNPAERAQLVGLAIVELGIVTWPEPGPIEKDARYCFFCAEEYPADTFDCPNHAALA